MKPIRIGTDCSGIEAPIQALLKLKIPFIHVFSSEIDKYCVQSIEANYNPDIIYKDISKRDLQKVPDIDLYVCGFPCQPFSMAGLRQGDKEDRGQIIFHCIELIRTKRPRYFILENVPGLISIDDGLLFETIMEKLNSLKGYKVKWKVLNTKDFGIPQNRQRLYIVGALDHGFKWPHATKNCKSLSSFVDFSDTAAQPVPLHVQRHKTFERIPKDSLFINLSFPRDKFPNSSIIAPCLMTSGNLWCVPFRRKANIKEHLSLQGFPRTFKQVVSDSQMKKQIGNSMSVCVLKAILTNLISKRHVENEFAVKFANKKYLSNGAVLY